MTPKARINPDLDPQTRYPLARGHWTLDELEAAFARVHDPADWRAAIDWQGLLSGQALNCTLDAIHFYTATISVATCPRGLRARQADGRLHVRITATGYRNGPAGP